MNFFKKNKKTKIFASSILLLAAIFLFFPNFVYAGVGEVISQVIGWILYPIIWTLGRLVVTLMGILIGVAQYSDFIHSNAVINGWVLVRDLCNMFFVIILLLIAFATILRIEQYNLKTWLPKLVLMAVLINFSKMICGVFIDFAQIVMLTFVNAFKDMAGANLTEMLGVTKILNFDQGSSEDVDSWSILGAIILALVFSIISVIVVLTMLVMLAMRIIMIWIYVVLSPLAYLLASFPQGQSYSQRWWTDFSKNLIVGPVLAFFIWLSFASLGGIGGSNDVAKMKAKKDLEAEYGIASETPSASITEAGSSDSMIKFIISIGMLLGGLQIAQEMGGAAGKIAGKGMAKIQAMGDGAMKVGKNTLKGAARRTGETALRTVGASGRLTGDGKGNKLTRLAGGWGKDMKESRQKRAVSSRQNIMEKMGMGERAGAAGQVLTGAIKSRLNIGDRRGQQKINEGAEKKVEGNIKLELAGNIERTQTRHHDLSNDLSDMNSRGVSASDPERRKVEKELKTNARELEGYKVEAGLSATASDVDTNLKVADLKASGGTEVLEGDSLIEEGEKNKGGYGKFGNLLIGSTNKAFKKLNSDHVEAEDFIKNLSLEPPSMGRISSGSFSGVGGSLNTKQKATFESLSKNDQASKNLEKTFTKTLFNADGSARKNVRKEDFDRASEFAQGAKTFKSASGGSLPTNIKNITDTYDKYIDAERPSGSKKTDEYTPGSYRISGIEKENQGMDINESGIGSVNEFGRDRGGDDAISYNFAKLKDKGINIEESAEGVYLNEENMKKAKVEIVSDIDAELGAIESKKLSIDLSVSQDNYKKLEGELGSMSVDDSRRGEVEQKLQKESTTLKGLKKRASIDENAGDQEVYTAIERENGKYQESKKNIGDKYDNMSSGALGVRTKNLEGAKNRLEKDDKFTLVDANKKMGLSETVVTKRHEGAHQELDEERKQNNFTPTESNKKQEEELVEFYGSKARQSSITEKSSDKEVAKIIFEGQKAGLSTDEIKVDISKKTGEYKTAHQTEKVSNIISKETASVQNTNNINSTNDINDTNNVNNTNNTNNINNINNVMGNTNNSTGGGDSVDLSGIERNIEKGFEKNQEDINKNRLNIKSVQGSVNNLAFQGGLQARINLFRHGQVKGAIGKIKS